jgi:hypothetical protein
MLGAFTSLGRWSGDRTNLERNSRDKCGVEGSYVANVEGGGLRWRVASDCADMPPLVGSTCLQATTLATCWVLGRWAEDVDAFVK